MSTLVGKAQPDKENMNETNKRRGGFYWNNEKPYVSVTQVLKVLEKKALRWWFGKEVYLAMVVDPTLSQSEALAAPYKKSEGAKDRGTTVHEFVENYKAGAKMPKEFEGDSELIGCYNAFLSFLKDHTMNVLSNETTVYNHEERYAGTLDLHAKVGGREMIIDVKTNKDASIYDEVALQLSAYNQPLSGGELPMFALALGADGNYAFKQQTNCYEEFLHAKALWEWQNKAKCNKVGYYQEGLFE